MASGVPKAWGEPCPCPQAWEPSISWEPGCRHTEHRHWPWAPREHHCLSSGRGDAPKQRWGLFACSLHFYSLFVLCFFVCFCVLQCRPGKPVFFVFFLCLRVSVFRERFLLFLCFLCVFCLFEGVKQRKNTKKTQNKHKIKHTKNTEKTQKKHKINRFSERPRNTQKHKKNTTDFLGKQKSDWHQFANTLWVSLQGWHR